MFQALQDFTQSFPDWLQWFGVAVVAAIPFIESYTGTLVGIAIGLHPVAAASAAIVGNAAAVIVVVILTSRIRRSARGAADPTAPSSGRARVRRMFERFGIPGVALLGHPTQISSAAMVGFGADQRKVLAWELASVVAWGSLFAVLGGLGIDLVLHA